MSVEVVTFGCRLNAAESETLRHQAEAAGLSNTVIFNSCAVTAEAVAQARQSIRRVKRDRPDAQIVVTGCAAQTEPATFSQMPEVDRVLGNTFKTSPKSWIEVKRAFDFGVSAEEKVRVGDLESMRETAIHLAEGFEGRTRAFVQVQNGCDHRCTFCIIPYGRGPSRSVPMGDVVAQVRRLVENDYREVVLTGIDITAWGADLPGRPRLGALVRAILKHVPELSRLRLSSIDSVEADKDLLAAFAGEERLMPHLHLSLQAGDDLILKRMKRRHLRAQSVAFCEEMRRLRPDIVFGADIIAGFPTETESQFRNSLSLVEDCGLTFLHVFPFSARVGTPAAKMPQLGRETAKDRARLLREKGDNALRRHLAAKVGQNLRALIEREHARCEDFTEVKLARAFEAGAIANLTIAGHDGKRLIAA
jgi:threonylcarbamoyladenosine tRNA methylthiotransferase MtaB